MLKSIDAVSGPLITTFHGHDVTRYPLEQGKNVYERLFEIGERFLGLDPVMADRLKGLGAPEDKVMVHPLGAIPDDFLTEIGQSHQMIPARPVRWTFGGKEGIRRWDQGGGRTEKIGRQHSIRNCRGRPLQGGLEALIDELARPTPWNCWARLITTTSASGLKWQTSLWSPV